MTAAVGTPNNIHWKKLGLGASGNSRVKAPRNTTLGGVPTGVPSPPIDAL